MANYKTSQYAAKFDCSPKTIARAMTGNPQASDWHDESYDIKDVAKKFKATSVAGLERVMRGIDNLITSEQAAKHLGISLRQFHNRQDDGTGPVKAISHGRIVRYFQSDVLDI